MSFAKFNVWIRAFGLKYCCEVVDREFLLLVYDCCGRVVFKGEFKGGHAEFDMPPGCYIVKAELKKPEPYPTKYTNRTMVIIRCGEEACVNLVLPAEKE